MLSCRITALEPISRVPFKSINPAQAIIHLLAKVDLRRKGLILLKSGQFRSILGDFCPILQITRVSILTPVGPSGILKKGRSGSFFRLRRTVPQSLSLNRSKFGPTDSFRSSGLIFGHLIIEVFPPASGAIECNQVQAKVVVGFSLFR